MTTVIRTAARGSVLMMAAHGWQMTAGYVVAVILARELGPSAYGIYGIVYSVLLGVELIARLGIPQALSKMSAEGHERSPRLEATGFTLTAVVYLGIFGLFWLFAPQLALGLNIVDGTRLFRIAALDIPFYGLYFVCNHTLNGRRDFANEALSVSLYALTRVLGMVALVYVGLTIGGALVVNILASVAGLAFSARRVGWRSFRITFRHAKSLMKLALPIGLFTLGSQGLLSLDLWSLNAFGTHVAAEVKGFYVAALNIARIPNVLSFVLTAILIPSIARAGAMEDREMVRRSVRGSARFLTITLLPFCVLVAAEARGVMELLFSSEYREGGNLLAILIFSQGLLYTVLMTGCAILIATGYARIAAVITLILLPFALALNMTFIRVWGATGAAMAALFTILVGATVAVAVVHRRVAAVMSVRTLVRALAATGLLYGLALAIRFEGRMFAVEFILVLIAYALVVLGSGLLSSGDLKLFLSRRDPIESGPIIETEGGPA
jgi:O-antigen/teichoic acid export membrane protein